MLINIGGERIIKSKDLIAVLDKHILSEQGMKDFLSKLEKSHTVQEKSFKSVVITTDAVHLSPLSSSTIAKRSRQLGL
ncbi:MAG: extracellular matrix regulator RemB [Bacillus sp. (in: firmicutes)]